MRKMSFGSFEIILNAPEAALIRLRIGMNDQVFFERTFSAEVLPAVRAEERSVELVDRSYVSLHIDGLGEPLITVGARMYELFLVWKMNLLVNLELLRTVKLLRALRAHEGVLVGLRVNPFDVIVQRLLVWVHFLALLAAEMEEKLSCCRQSKSSSSIDSRISVTRFQIFEPITLGNSLMRKGSSINMQIKTSFHDETFSIHLSRRAMRVWGNGRRWVERGESSVSGQLPTEMIWLRWHCSAEVNESSTGVELMSRSAREWWYALVLTRKSSPLCASFCAGEFDREKPSWLRMNRRLARSSRAPSDSAFGGWGNSLAVLDRRDMNTLNKNICESLLLGGYEVY